VKKVVLGFSGGVDSFFSAYLLKKQGYEVIPVFLKILPSSNYERAQKAAEILNLPLLTLNVQEEFKKTVVEYFISYYKNGLTPNPCAVCNRDVKLNFLYKVMKNEKADYVSTGHYAKAEWVERFNRRLIKRGADKKKEQSYFLALVKGEVIEKLILPLGNFHKKQVVEEAKRLGFPFKGESQDICFIKNNYVEFLKKYIPEREGSFKLEDGTEIGKHTGYFKFTIGQRRGLGISYKYPLYVVKLHPQTNTVIVGPKESVFKEEFKVWNLNWHVEFEQVKGLPIEAQVRYRSKPVTVSSLEYFTNGIYRVKLAAKVEAPTPGQVCAFYAEDVLLGGGEITEEGNGGKHSSVRWNLNCSGS